MKSKLNIIKERVRSEIDFIKAEGKADSYSLGRLNALYWLLDYIEFMEVSK